MKNSFAFFENKECQYYPCHEGLEELNCLFCYCPLYFLPECPGNREVIQRKDGVIRSCMNCDYPHRPENYGEIMRILQQAIREGNVAKGKSKQRESEEER